MSPCEAVFAEMISTAGNNVEKRLWLEAKGAVRRLGEIPLHGIPLHGIPLHEIPLHGIPLHEIFPICKCVIKVPDRQAQDIFGSFLWAEDQGEFIVSKSDSERN